MKKIGMKIGRKKGNKSARELISPTAAGAPNSSRLSLEGVLISWARAARACVVLSSHCPLSMALAMSLLAASVKWIPSHEMDLDGSAHAVDPGAPQNVVNLKLYGPPQHAANGASPKPATGGRHPCVLNVLLTYC